MKKWIENQNETLTHEDLKAFAYGLASSQGTYGRIFEALNNMTDYEIKELNEKLENLNFKNDLMTIIEIFEG
jgi:hypothetical protein